MTTGDARNRFGDDRREDDDMDVPLTPHVRAEVVARQEEHNTMRTMLSAVIQPSDIAPHIRASRLSPEQSEHLFSQLTPMVLEHFDTDATRFGAIRAQAGDEQAVQLDAHAMVLAGSYLRYLSGTDNHEQVLRNMFNLHDALAHESGTVDPTDAQEAVHEIMCGVSYLVQTTLKEARTRSAENVR